MVDVDLTSMGKEGQRVPWEVHVPTRARPASARKLPGRASKGKAGDNEWNLKSRACSVLSPREKLGRISPNIQILLSGFPRIVN